MEPWMGLGRLGLRRCAKAIGASALYAYGGYPFWYDTLAAGAYVIPITPTLTITVGMTAAPIQQAPAQSRTSLRRTIRTLRRLGLLSTPETTKRH